MNYAKFKGHVFPDCREITGDELYTINGGKLVENSNEGVANAQPGDTIIRDDHTEITLNQGDIDWAQAHTGSGNNSTQPTQDSVNTNPVTNLTNPTGCSSEIPESSFTNQFSPITTGNYEIDKINQVLNEYIQNRRNILDTHNESTGYSKAEIKKFKKMSVEEQLAFLKNEISSVKSETVEAGTKAKYMRSQLKSSMKLKGLFFSQNGDEIFMNEELRSFLNLNEKGKNEYKKSEMTLTSGWHKMIPFLGDNEHQHNQNGGRNVKYYNIDGREAIFDAKGNYIGDGLDAATFNYGVTGNLNIISITLGSSHGQFDMKPFYRQNGEDSKWWSMHVGKNYGFNSR